MAEDFNSVLSAFLEYSKEYSELLPYYVILQGKNEGEYSARRTSEPFYYKGGTNAVTGEPQLDAESLYYLYGYRDGEWGGGGAVNLTKPSWIGCPVASIIYSNYDILNEDGSVYISGTNVKVTGITISAPNTVTCGLYGGIAAIVSGEGEYNNTATCTMSGGNSNATMLDSLGNNQWRLYVGADETADSITVTVASVQFPSITASKTITVKPRGEESGDSGDFPGGDSDGGTGGTGGSSGDGSGGDNSVSAEALKEAYMSGLATGLALYSVGV